MTDTHLTLVCPSCKTTLIELNNRLECPTCHVAWPIVDGVPSFIQSTGFWGEDGVSEQAALELVEKSADRNWREVIREMPALKKHQHSICDTHRADWCDLLDLGEEATVLDLGAGMGAVSQSLSSRFRRVYSVEPVEARLQFLSMRFAQEGCSGISLIRAGVDALPFQENTFDLIVLCGVLEWLPFARKQKNPREAQLYYLELLRKLLKPGGVIYVGIENRFTYDLLMGAPDPHIDLKGVAVMPRWMADIICKRRLGDRYRPYLYSKRGYDKLMAQAGFRACRVLSALPSYYNAKKIRPLTLPSSEWTEDVWRSKHPLSRLVKRAVVALDLLKYMGYAYVVFAEK